MPGEAPPIDATGMPDLARLVHEVNETGRPRLIHAGGETARLSAARPARRRTALTARQREQILRATFGSWQGLVDPDRVKRELNELQRDEPTSPGQ